MKELGYITIKNKSNKVKEKRYIFGIFFLTTLISFFIGTYLYLQNKNIFTTILYILIIYIPVSEIVIKLVNYFLSKAVKPKTIPKLDFSKGLPKEYSTMVVVPTIINSKEKVQEILKKLEVYYLANKTDNLYFALLGDCTSSKNEKEKTDDEIIKVGLQITKELNKKYSNSLDNVPKFYFLYRKRIWNNSEECYLGWERKRGLLYEFNQYLVKGNNSFLINTINDYYINKTISKIKYVITLDADTNLIMGSALELIGSMAHILNKPVLNKEQTLVIKGHAIIQPRVGINLEANRKSIFTKLYAGIGGIDSYTNAISDIYQDNFDEGIFIGKGIYDIEIFHKILSNQIPENTVLSHDLLEGSYLRCGLASDILVLDDYPSSYNTYCLRQERWIRGDFQIATWLKKHINKTNKKNPLTLISKFKILDNLRRSLLHIFVFVSLLFITNLQIATICLIGYIFSTILDILNYIIFKEGKNLNFIYAHKSFISTINPVKASIIRGILEISFLPHKAYFSILAILKTIYRVNISKKHLLEWLTAEQAEQQSKQDLISYYKFMYVNLVFGIWNLVFGIFENRLLIVILGILWIFAPLICWYISKDIKIVQPIDRISNNDKQYLLEIGKRIWQYFKDNINEGNNYLPPDNYQEDRKNKVARENFDYKHRTSECFR